MTKDKTCSIPGCRCKGQAIGHSEAEQGFAYWKARGEKAEAERDRLREVLGEVKQALQTGRPLRAISLVGQALEGE